MVARGGRMSTIQLEKYAVYGSPIKHSKSPLIHQWFATQTGQNISYDAIEVTAPNFVNAVDRFFADGGKGLNCTVPLKELAWNYAENKSERAKYSKAVNTLILQEDGTVYGDNTDGIGLVRDLTNNQAICLDEKRILILGAGGASRGILEPLLEQSPGSIIIANRTVSKALELANEFVKKGIVSGCGYADLNDKKFDLILNATSASLTGQLPPLPGSILEKNGICYDLAYGNEPTAFVRWGFERKAAKSLDGLGMLVEQAAEAFYLWRGVRPDTGPVIRELKNRNQ
jgi:shikimate dehydrogenase